MIFVAIVGSLTPILVPACQFPALALVRVDAMQQKEVPLSDIEPIALRPHDEGRMRGSRIHKTHSAVPAHTPAGIYFDRCELSQRLG